MKMRVMAALLAVLVLVSLTGCGEEKEIPLKENQMQEICRLSVLDCYYHNVAKYLDEDAGGVLWFQKDKHFWVEYSGRVRFGVNGDLIQMDVQDNVVTITMPAAEMQACEPELDHLTEDDYIVDKDSVKVSVDDCYAAVAMAQEKLEAHAAADETMLKLATRRAKDLLEKYVDGIGEVTGIQYEIVWNDVDADGNPLDPPAPADEPQLAETPKPED